MKNLLHIMISAAFFVLGGAILNPAVLAASSSGQQNLLEASQKAQDASVRQSPQSHLESSATVPDGPDHAGQSGSSLQESNSSARSKAAIYLEIAWWHHNKGDDKKAIPLFQQAAQSKDPAIANEARLGLSYALNKRNETGEAVSLLEKLVDERFRLDETAPALVELLLRQKNYEKAEKYLPLMP